MAPSEKLLESLSTLATPQLIAPPVDASGVCSGCRSACEVATTECESCESVRESLGLRELVPVFPITLYEKPSLVRDWLSFYKPGSDELVWDYSVFLAAILHRYFKRNKRSFIEAFGEIGGVCTVPSSRFRPPQILEATITDARLPWPILSALEIQDGSPFERNKGNVSAFVATSEDLQGKRLVIIDDVYTTGAHAQSAAQALIREGATPLFICAIGRRVNAHYSEMSASLLRSQSELAFDYSDPRLGDLGN